MHPDDEPQSMTGVFYFVYMGTDGLWRARDELQN